MVESMSKYRVTKKSMNEDYRIIISTGYCNLQHLLQYTEPFAYSTRAEGWACDYYDVDGVLICTGYAPMKGKRNHSTYEIEHDYDNKARELRNTITDWEENIKAINTLLHEYVQKVTEV